MMWYIIWAERSGLGKGVNKLYAYLSGESSVGCGIGAYITHFTNGSLGIIFYWHSGWDDNVLHFTNERYWITS